MAIGSTKFTHLNGRGEARMVDVGEKPVTSREAIAHGFVRMRPATLAAVRGQKMGKGDVLAVARVAGIMAAKRVDELIPLCHSVALTSVTVLFEFEKKGIKILATAKCDGKTGVEMEALTAAGMAALTIYDMCKAIDKDMAIGPIYLLEKSGGRSGNYKRKM